MKREDVLREIIGDDAITAAILALSKAHKKEDLDVAMPEYFRLCAALGDLITRLKLSADCPEEYKNHLEAYMPYLTVGMPGFSKGFCEALCDQKFRMADISDEESKNILEESVVRGDAGEPNYIHGILIADTVGESLKRLHVMVLGAEAQEMIADLEMELEHPFANEVIH